MQPMYHNSQVAQQSVASRTSIGGYAESPTSPPGHNNQKGHSYNASVGAAPPMAGGGGGGGPLPGPQPYHQHERSFSHSSMGSQSNVGPPYGGARGSTQAPMIPSSRFNNSSVNANPTLTSPQGAPQLGALPFQNPRPQSPSQSLGLTQSQSPPASSIPPLTNPLQQHPPGPAGPQSGPVAARNQSPPRMAPNRPVFGLSLNRLYERDGLAVPMVVYQCIQAVDLFGLGVEGIYRLSGSVPHVNKLKGLFDHGMAYDNIPHSASSSSSSTVLRILS